MKTPILIVNFKTYKEATGKNALKLAKICESVSKMTTKSIAIAVQPADIRMIVNAVKIPVLAQHIDDIDYGSHTGHILAESIKEAGAIGSLINHSEKRLNLKEIKARIEKLKSLKLKSIVCEAKPEMTKKIANLNPDIIAIEPPELIGGNISVSTAKPGIITKAVKATKIPVLCGAGVKTYNDVSIARKLGSKGILIASGITKAKNPKKALLELVHGL